MAIQRPAKKLTIADNNMLIVEDNVKRKIEIVISLTGKYLRPHPSDTGTILISDQAQGIEGYGIHFKAAYGSGGERFADIDAMLKYLAPKAK